MMSIALFIRAARCVYSLSLWEYSVSILDIFSNARAAFSVLAVCSYNADVSFAVSIALSASL